MRWLRSMSVMAALLLAALVPGCAGSAGGPEPGAGQVSETSVTQLRVEVLERYPHDTEAFTQGLELHDGVLYEGTGLYGRSEIRSLEPETGELRQRVELPAEFFGEGLTIVDDRIWQLTWQENVAFSRDRETLAEQDRAEYEGEGWGLCHDAAGQRLVMSDGTARLTFRDPVSFAAVGTVDVTRDGQPVAMLNELECVDDRVWANIWQTDEIVRIDPSTGQVDAVVDAADLLTAEERVGTDVLNGIAAVPDTDTFLITGKLWPTIFLVRFVPA